MTQPSTARLLTEANAAAGYAAKPLNAARAVGQGELVVRPEEYGALGNGVADDMGAFQRASNALHTAGGGTLLLTAPSYYLSQYSAAAVSSKILDATITVPAKVWQIPSDTTVRAAGHTTLYLDGGSSSPFGYDLAVNVLAFPGEENFVTVTAATNATRSVVVASATGLAVGQQIRLARAGGNTAGIPNTPSQEGSPNQFLTIASISGTTVTFKEGFFHNFEAAQALQVAYPKTGGFPGRIHLEGITFAKPAASAVGGYVLLSRVIGSSVDRFELLDTGMSWGTSEQVDIGSFTVRVPTAANANLTIESTSRVRIDRFHAEGYGSTNDIGPLFFSDNCRQVKIGKYSANQFSHTGLALLYGFSGRVDQIDLVDCGTAATGTAFNGALTIGFPATGAHGSLAAAEAAAFKLRNNGPSDVSIGRLSVRGAAQVPLRIHDADVHWDDAYLEFANPNLTGEAPVLIGESGERRADATYYPKGGRTRIDGRFTRIVTKSGAPAVISTTNGYTAGFHAGVTTVPGGAPIGASTITVADATALDATSAPLYYMDETSVSPNVAAVAVASITGNVVTLTAPLTAPIAAGAGVWGYDYYASELLKRANLGTVILDDAAVPSSSFDGGSWPNFTTGTGPYTAPVTLTLPAQGEYELHVSIISRDNAHFVNARYLITWSTANTTYPLEGVALLGKNLIRSAVDITSVTVAAGVVTITASCASSGYQARVRTRLVPIRPVIRFGD